MQSRMQYEYWLLRVLLDRFQCQARACDHHGYAYSCGSPKKSVLGNVPEPVRPPQKRLRKRIENVSLILRFQTPPRRTETHWKRIENAPGRRREKRGNAKNVFNAFPKAKEETHWKRFRKRCRKRIENVRGENGKKQTQRKRIGNVAAQTSLQKQTKSRRFGNALNVSWPPEKGNAKETQWKRSERFQRHGNATETH